MTKENNKPKPKVADWKLVHPVSFRISPQLKARIRRVSVKTGITQSSLIKHCLATALPKLEREYETKS
mgnify:CR=1 FL=1